MTILIVLLGAALVYLLERYIYKKYWDRGLDIRVNFDGSSAFEGETGELTEVLENRNFLPLPFVHAKFRIGSGLVFENQENVSTSDQNYKNDIFSVLFYQKITRRLSFHCAKRGYYEITDADIVSSDLFYNEHMVKTIDQHTAFYVYPGRVNTAALEQPLRKIIGEMTMHSFLYPDPFEFKGIRSYTLNDPMNTINWKASARAGELMVNLYDSTTSRRIVIFLNLEDETVVRHPTIMEESIRIAATLCARMLQQGYPITIKENGVDYTQESNYAAISANGAAQLQEIYRLLSRIDLFRISPDLTPHILEELENPDLRTAAYVLISSSMKQELQDAIARISQEATALWVLPLYRNMDTHIENVGTTEVIRWEVEGHA